MKYQLRSVVVLAVAELPTFGVIVDILTSDSNTYFVCEVPFTVCFNRHFYTYEIYRDAQPEYVLCSHSDLADPYVLSQYSVSSKIFVPLKYHLVDSESL